MRTLRRLLADLFGLFAVAPYGYVLGRLTWWVLSGEGAYGDGAAGELGLRIMLGVFILPIWTAACLTIAEAVDA
jgi:hypothetical protein